MTQHNSAELSESLSPTVHVPLSERPLVADDENTVISVPESARSESRTEVAPAFDVLRQRLFPAGGVSTGEEAGIRLAHFEIRQRIGSGGMGAVFRATDLELARDVALKILHPGSSQDSSLILRFRNEARACAQLSHDNIARVFYAGSQDGLHFIAYEFASGRTIRDLILERGRLSISETVNYAIQVTLALNHIAAAGIVHRDIKPSNIMLTENGRVKVVDLGLARRDTSDSIGDITVAGTTLGTFDYIAPEQARDPRNADVRSDIYSLGCTMYHMLTGQPPYPEGTALQKLLDHQGKSAPDPRSINGQVPLALSAIMKKMMDSQPEHRYQAAGLLLNDLIHVAGQLGLHSVPAEGIVWKRGVAVAGRQPLGAIWVFASVVLICLTAVFLHRFPGAGSGTATVPEEDSWREVRPEDYAAVESSSGGGTSTIADPAGATNTPITPGERTGSAPPTQTGTTTVPNPELAAVPTTGLLSPGLVQLVLGTSSSMSGSGPTADTAAVQPEMGPFILQRADGVQRSFRTLKAAVADAKSGELILLRFNGYPDDLPSQPPVRIVGTNLSLRAAEGFRPTLEFDGTADGSVTPGQIFSLRSNAQLTIRNIDLRLVVGSEVDADRWSLFHCAGANRIELDNVSVECLNDSGQSVVVFDLTDDSAGTLPGTAEETEVLLNHVICRAQADGFRIACQPRGRITMQNCGVAINGSLIDLRGDNSMQPARGSLELLMEHVTCLHSDPLVELSDREIQQTGAAARLLPRLSVRSEGCVFAGRLEDQPIIFAATNSFSGNVDSMVTWNGYTNLYQDGEFWVDESSSLDESGRRLDFTQWKQLWQNRADGEDSGAELLPANSFRFGQWIDPNEVLLSSVTPASFELDASLFLPGPGSMPRARDGNVPGVNSQELPPFPVRRRASAPPADSASTAGAVGTVE